MAEAVCGNPSAAIAPQARRARNPRARSPRPPRKASSDPASAQGAREPRLPSPSRPQDEARSAAPGSQGPVGRPARGWAVRVVRKPSLKARAETTPSILARFARALHTAIKKGRGAHTFSLRQRFFGVGLFDTNGSSSRFETRRAKGRAGRCSRPAAWLASSHSALLAYQHQEQGQRALIGNLGNL